jgi:nucleoid-associated protein YgaU
MTIVTMLVLAVVLAGCKKTEGPGTMEPSIPTASSRTAEQERPSEPAAQVPRIDQPAEAETIGPPEADSPPPAESPERPRVYVVEKGDTLWAIAKQFLGSGNRWRELVAANPGLEPEKLSIGREIIIPPK